MARFSYTAKNGPARTVQGDIAAESRDQAVARLEATGLTPILVEPAAGDPKARAGSRSAGRGIRRADVTVFTRQLASLTKSGVPILRALRTIGEQTANQEMRRTVEQMARAIRDGGMLSDALTPSPRLFPDLYVNMIRAGESGGALDAVLYRLTEAREKEDEIRRRVQAALAYPALILVTGAVTIVLLMVFFVPRLLDLFSGYGTLPMPTRVLLALSGFLSHQWPWMVGVLAVVAVLFRRVTAAEWGRVWADRLILRLPLLGELLRLREIARYARTLSLLLQVGVPVDRGLALSADVVENAALRGDLRRVRDVTVKQGLPVSEAIRRCTRLPPMVPNMMAVGEEGGRLEESLSEVADFYEKGMDQTIRIVTSLIEPLLILALGGIVGLIVAAMLLPIFEIGVGMR
jgi:type II secretory pathway component PulF